MSQIILIDRDLPSETKTEQIIEFAKDREYVKFVLVGASEKLFLILSEIQNPYNEPSDVDILNVFAALPRNHSLHGSGVLKFSEEAYETLELIKLDSLSVTTLEPFVTRLLISFIHIKVAKKLKSSLDPLID